MKVFVTGTDTDVGKTVVSAWLVCHWRATYWKPIQSGPEHDCDRVAALVPGATILPPRYTLTQPLSPHLAASLDGVQIGLDDLTLPNVTNPLVIEGAGGVMVPINNDLQMIDVMAKFGLPVVLVARSTLGTINHTLLSLAALRSRSIAILGVVMSGLPNPHNRQAIEHFGRVRVLAELPPLNPLTPQTLASHPCPINPL